MIRQADEDVRIHIAQFSRADLERDLAEAANLRTTRMYTLLHAREWRGVFGLYSFGPSAADIEMLGRIALLAANAHAPFIAEGAIDMGEHWSELQQIPESSRLALALPRFLLRLPYGAKTDKIEAFSFEEMPGVLDGSPPRRVDYLWGHPAGRSSQCSREHPETRRRRNGDEDLDLRHFARAHLSTGDGEAKDDPDAPRCG